MRACHALWLGTDVIGHCRLTCTASFPFPLQGMWLSYSTFDDIFCFLAEWTEGCRLLRSMSTFSVRTHTCGELTLSDVASQVKVCGWLQYLRYSGLFLVVRDAFGTVQAVVSNPEVFARFVQLPLFKIFNSYSMDIISFRTIFLRKKLVFMSKVLLSYFWTLLSMYKWLLPLSFKSSVQLNFSYYPVFPFVACLFSYCWLCMP